MNQHDDTEFTDGLRASLSDDRFALRPTASARDAIVAAARRRRRRREVGYATGGSLAVAVVLLGGFLLVNPHQPEKGTTLAEDAQTSQTTGARAEARAESGPPSAAPMATGSDHATRERMAPVPDDRAQLTHLGPEGYRSLRLGMSYDEIRETGMLADPNSPPPRDCVRYRLVKDDLAVRAILVSENGGLVSIVANRASTPEGIAVGSTRERLERTYDATEAADPAQYEIPTGAGGYYLFRVDGDRVSELSLVADEQDCGLR